jgi:hypothetical protein
MKVEVYLQLGHSHKGNLFHFYKMNDHMVKRQLDTRMQATGSHEDFSRILKDR